MLGAILYGGDFDQCGCDIAVGRFDQVPLNLVIKSQNKIIYTVVDV